MTRLRQFLTRREVAIPLGILYLAGAAFVGGPWFALLTGGFVLLVVGFVWWLSRDLSRARVGTAMLATGFAMSAGGLVIGNTPTLFPDRDLPYQPIIPRPTEPVVRLPLAVPETEAFPSPLPSPSQTPEPTTRRVAPARTSEAPEPEATSERPTTRPSTRPPTQEPSAPPEAPPSSDPPRTDPPTQPPGDDTTTDPPAPSDPPPSDPPPSNPPAADPPLPPADPPSPTPPGEPDTPPSTPAPPADDPSPDPSPSA